MDNEIEAAVLAAVRAQFPKAEVRLGAIVRTTTFEQLGADSVDGVELLMSIEEALQVELGEEELLQTNSVGDLIDRVETAREDARA